MLTRLILCATLLAAPALADEVLVVTTPPPVVQDVPVRYELTDLCIRTWPDARIEVTLTAMRADGACARDVRGVCQTLGASYQGATAVTMLNALNTANLSTKSLRRRILERLQTDGVLPAAVISGAAGVSTPTPVPAIP